MKKNWKRIALLLLMVVLVSGCDNRTDAKESDAAADTAAAAEETGGESAAEQGGGQEGEVLTFADAFTDLKVVDLDGNEVTSELFAEHDLTLINLWGTYCGYCLDEMPGLAELNREYQEAGESFQVVGVCADAVKTENQDGGTIFVPYEENVKKARELVEETGADYPHLLPVKELGRSLTQTAEAAYIPMTIFVDREGNCVSEYILGAREKEEWKKLIDEQLEEIKNAG